MRNWLIRFTCAHLWARYWSNSTIEVQHNIVIVPSLYFLAPKVMEALWVCTMLDGLIYLLGPLHSLLHSTSLEFCMQNYCRNIVGIKEIASSFGDLGCQGPLVGCNNEFWGSMWLLLLCSEPTQLSAQSWEGYSLSVMQVYQRTLKY